MDFNNNGKDDIQELRDGFAQLKNDLLSGSVSAVIDDIAHAGDWLEDFLNGLAADAKAFFQWGMDRVKAESQTAGEAVANMLTLLANGELQRGLGVAEEAIAQLFAISSQIVEAAVALMGLNASAKPAIP